MRATMPALVLLLPRSAYRAEPAAASTAEPGGRREVP